MKNKLFTATLIGVVLVLALFVVAWAQEDPAASAGATPPGTQLGRNWGMNGRMMNGGGRMLGFVDGNQDGVCDHFVDKDGNGVCDLAGQGGMMQQRGSTQRGAMQREAMQGQSRMMNGHGLHRGIGRGIGFVDANGDGVCDHFVDANGDGVNDKAPRTNTPATPEAGQ